MTQLTVSIAIGTAATMLAAIFLMLRVSSGRQFAVALTRRWVSINTSTSILVLAFLCAVALSGFAHRSTDERIAAIAASPLGVFARAPSAQGSAPLPAVSSEGSQALDALRAYADKIEPSEGSSIASAPDPMSAAMPDVDSMIAKLITRLEKQPGDVKGWKMLGWSLLNTNNPKDAATAYETALKLAPSDVEIQKGLDAAIAAQTAVATTEPPGTGISSSAEVKADASVADLKSNGMIRDMVDGLAARLERAPNDEDAWMRLMRSRVTLGEKDAAKTALMKALETFSDDADAKARLTSAARDLGVETN
ncbi:MAG TPA: tetratricopeptide repeat protein [Hyphomicrobium sp.]|nr:tetratricopeptide repeat protein [Hyphomicrobium sp.]